MARLSLLLNGREYAIGCEDGQEDRVRALAARFDDRVRAIAAEVGAIDEARLFLMAGLIAEDDARTAQEATEAATAALEGAARHLDDLTASILEDDA